MLNQKLIFELSKLSTPHLADACLATNNPVRIAPEGIKPLSSEMRFYGRALPVQHIGSIDIFFEAFESITDGDVIVVDNGGRMDEGPIGDIVTSEAMTAGASGFVIWGCNRDQSELIDINFPVFSQGAVLTGPQRTGVRPGDVLSRANIGSVTVTRKDFVVADANGVIFLAEDVLEEIILSAMEYRDREARILKNMNDGVSFREQTQFSGYLAKREKDPSYDFRAHLKSVSAAGEA